MAYSNHTYTLSQWAKDMLDDQSNTVEYEFHKPNPDAGITMHAQGGDEMLKITRDGFYVRGIRVPADDKEAEAVYLAFKQWLTWAQLQQQR
jgi:hypothetical protein